MSGLRLLLTRAVRSNGRAILGLALVIAIAGGASMTALTAARRTSSAFSRYLVASDASDLAVNVVATSYDGSVDGSLAGVLPFTRRARSLPGIEADSTYVGLETIFLGTKDGSVSPVGAEVLGSLDGRFLDSDRVALTAGRLPHRGALDEVFLNESAAAATGSTVGSTLHLVVLASSEGDPREIPVVDRVAATVVGIGLFPDEVLADDFDRSARVLVTPATTQKYLDVAGSYSWQGLHLASGMTADKAISEYQSILDEGYGMNVQRTDEQVASVQRSIHPLVAALVAFGLATGVAALLLGALGAVRLAGGAAANSRTLRAIGVAPRGVGAAVAAPALLSVLIGAVGAMAVALALSPLGPIGAVRAVEPTPGLRADATVLLGCGAVLCAVLGLTATLAAWTAMRRQNAPVTADRPSRAIDAIARSGLRPTAAIGAGHALGTGGGAGAASRSTIVGCAISVIAVVSALTFGAGAHQVLADPHRYGWAADFAIETAGGYERINPDGGKAVVENARGTIQALAVTGNGKLRLRSREVNAMGLIPVVGVAPITVLAGRLPRTPHEIALGRVTARELRSTVGESLTGPAGPLRVVGLVALPAIGPQASSHPSLGQGALLSFAGLAAQDDTAFPGVVLVDLRPGADARKLSPTIKQLVSDHMTSLPSEASAAYRNLRPADIIGLSTASRTAYLLAMALIAAAVLSMALTLSASVRRRARTYAVLTCLGFDGAAVRGTVRWQTDVVMGVSVLLGLPLGIATGRVAWRSFAEQLGVESQPTVPLLLIAVSGVSLLIVANLAAIQPARNAVRHSRLVRTLTIEAS